MSVQIVVFIDSIWDFVEISKTSGCGVSFEIQVQTRTEIAFAEKVTVTSPAGQTDTRIFSTITYHVIIQGMKAAAEVKHDVTTRTAKI